MDAPMSIVMFAAFGILGMANLKAPGEFLRSFWQRHWFDSLGMEGWAQTIRFQQFSPNATTDCMYIVAFNDFGMLGMANPKAALESKATAAAASILLTSGQEFPRPPHNVRSQELGSLTTPDPLYIVVFSAVAS